MRLFNLFKNLISRFNDRVDQDTVRWINDTCATGLDNIVAFAKTYRRGNRTFAFNVDSSVAGSVSDPLFGTSSCTVFAKFTSVNYGWILCLSDNQNVTMATAIVNVNTYGWVSPFRVVKSQTFSALGKSWYFRKIGRVVYVDSNSDISSAPAGATNIGTLDADMRPEFTTYIPCGNQAGATRFLTITPSGVVSVYTSSAITSATNFGFHDSYIANLLT